MRNPHATPSRVAVSAVSILFAGLAAPRRADACASAPPPGQSVGIVAEEALIAWDPQTRTEHFVRRAQFTSTAKDFGFLVPTPSPPTLAEASGAVFSRLAERTKPLVQHVSELDPSFSCLGAMTLATRSAPAEQVALAAVEVLAIEHVAGYEAAVLRADDATALRTWLEQHGYAARPALTEWLSTYVARKWTVTAFKIADAAGNGRHASAAVRMTFATDRPFYPYKEPADGPRDPSSPRSLRVFFVSSAGRFAGTVGSGPFAGELTFARSVGGLSALLAGSVPAGAVPDVAWLHEFVDASTPRPGSDDLFFAPASAPGEVVPAPVIVRETRRILLPLDLVALLGGVALLVTRLLGRGRSR